MDWTYDSTDPLTGATKWRRVVPPTENVGVQDRGAYLAPAASLGDRLLDPSRKVLPNGRAVMYVSDYIVFLNTSPGGPSPPSGAAGGDLGGTYPNPTVVAIHSSPVPTLASGYLHFNGSVFVWDTPTLTGAAGGDLSGTYPNPEVAGLLNKALPSLTTGYLHYTGSAWALTALPTSLPPNGAAGGDLAGTYPNPSVAGILTKALPSLPGTDKYLHYTGSAWAFSTLSAGFTAGGDLSGTSTNQTVIGIQTVPVNNTAPTDKQILMAQSAWTPTLVSGLEAWYRADLLVTQSGTVSAWGDSSGVGDANRNLTSSTQPLYNATDANFNNHPSIQFSVSSSYLRSGIWSSPRNQPQTIFLVTHNPTPGHYAVDARVDTGTSQQAIYNPSGLWAVYAGAGPVIDGAAVGPSVIAGVFNNAGSSSIYVNSTTAAASGATGTHNCDGITVGNYAGGGGFEFGGTIAEVIVFNGILSSGDFNNVAGYLANRYGISVAGSTVPSGAATWVPVSLSGDVAVSSDTGTLEVTGLLSSALPSLPGSDQYLHYTGSAWAFSTLPTAVTVASGTGISVTGGPAYTVALSTPVSVSNGGTGTSTFAAHNLLVGNGSSTPNTLAPGASGNVATSDGTDWTSAAPLTSVAAFGSGSVTVPDTGVDTNVGNATLTIPTGGATRLHVVAAFNIPNTDVTDSADAIKVGVGLASATYSHSERISAVTQLSGGAGNTLATVVYSFGTLSAGSHTIWGIATDLSGLNWPGVTVTILGFTTT